MQLDWSALAFEDRVAIFDYIEADNPIAAIGVDDRIQEQIDQLKRFPDMGRPGRVTGTRELIITHTPYVVAYRITSEVVTILRILHGAQQWPAELE